MKDFQIYLAGGMSKFAKENFTESDNWRRHCKYKLIDEENYKELVFLKKYGNKYQS